MIVVGGIFFCDIYIVDFKIFLWNVVLWYFWRYILAFFINTEPRKRYNVWDQSFTKLLIIFRLLRSFSTCLLFFTILIACSLLTRNNSCVHVCISGSDGVKCASCSSHPLLICLDYRCLSWGLLLFGLLGCCGILQRLLWWWISFNLWR